MCTTVSQVFPFVEYGSNKIETYYAAKEESIANASENDILFHIPENETHFRTIKDKLIDELEVFLLLRAEKKYGSNISRIAASFDVSRKTIYRLIQKHKLEKETKFRKVKDMK